MKHRPKRVADTHLTSPIAAIRRAMVSPWPTAIPMPEKGTEVGDCPPDCRTARHPTHTNNVTPKNSASEGRMYSSYLPWMESTLCWDVELLISLLLSLDIIVAAFLHFRASELPYAMLLLENDSVVATAANATAWTMIQPTATRGLVGLVLLYVHRGELAF